MKQYLTKLFYEKRTKGLCFLRDEKFVTSHNCRKKQLNKIEVYDEKDTELDAEIEPIEKIKLRIKTLKHL